MAMSNPSEPEKLEAILRMAARMQRGSEQKRSSEVHFTEDDELLTCLGQGLLGPKERQEIVEHLAVCPRCCKQLAELIRSGVVELSEDVPAVRVKVPAARRVITWARLAVAASILVCCGLLWWVSGLSPSERLLAQAETELKAGNPAGALEGTERALGESLRPEAAARARSLAEQAGYEAAAAELHKGDYSRVLAIEDRVSRRVPPSARLRNLKLQAERGMPSEFALDVQGTLLDYGYEPDGSSPRMAMPILDETTERLDREYRALLAEHPGDVKLLLNRGQFLLSIARYDEARQCFAAVLAGDPQNHRAELGLGLVDFEEQKFAGALARFEAVLAVEPANIPARVNAAVCLERLGRTDEAKRQWRQVLESAPNSALRQRIEWHLSSTAGRP
jgi:tetratricopeptide (TPR) repeat protein